MENTFRAELSLKVRAYLDSNKLSQQKAAIRLKVGKGRIADWIKSAGRIPNRREIERIDHAVGGEGRWIKARSGFLRSQRRPKMIDGGRVVRIGRQAAVVWNLHDYAARSLDGR